MKKLVLVAVVALVSVSICAMEGDKQAVISQDCKGETCLLKDVGRGIGSVAATTWRYTGGPVCKYTVLPVWHNKLTTATVATVAATGYLGHKALMSRETPARTKAAIVAPSIGLVGLQLVRTVRSWKKSRQTQRALEQVKNIAEAPKGTAE